MSLPGEPRFDLNDFRVQVSQIRRVGSVQEILRLIPGLGPIAGTLAGLDLDAEVRRIEGIIDSMTPQERANPAGIDASRRRRIAAGAGVFPAEVASLLAQYEAMAGLVRQMAALSLMDNIRNLQGSSPRILDAGRSNDRSRPGESGRVELKHLHIERPMNAQERATLRRVWEIFARHGRTPETQEPWFSNWNRNLRLWDFPAD
jgi:signal recognition particle subunit SRP54